MLSEPVNFKKLLGVEKPTDFEISMHILRLMNNYLLGSPSFKNQDFERGIMVKLAEKALKTMTNPHTKKLLLDKIDEFNKKIL